MHLRFSCRTALSRSCRTTLLGLLLTLSACGGPAPAEPDAGWDAGRLIRCETDVECDDGSFCTGRERCDIGSPGADERGCIGLEPVRCRAGQTCDERRMRCVTGCTAIRDADGDGAAAMECGGDDCDDNDPDRFPGNTEGCDASEDRDCDPSTIGTMDGDGDGAMGIACGGDDCDDNDANRFPGNIEICDAIDQDCDALSIGNLDADGDRVVSALCCNGALCGADCDDGSASVNPSAVEMCNGLDDDCDGLTDEGCMPPP